MSSGSIIFALATAALALVPLALWAQPPANVAVPTIAVALVPSASSLDRPIEDIAACFGGGAVLDKDFPGLRTHTMYRLFKTMSLNQIAAMSHGRITAEMLLQAETDLAALPVEVVAQRVPQTDSADLDFASPDVAEPLNPDAQPSPSADTSVKPALAGP